MRVVGFSQISNLRIPIPQRRLHISLPKYSIAELVSTLIFTALIVGLHIAIDASMQRRAIISFTHATIKRTPVKTLQCNHRREFHVPYVA
jgi:hypothetical protein